MRFKTSGCLGDLLYQLPAIRGLTNKATIYLEPNVLDGPKKYRFTPEGIDKVLPLLRSQSWVEAADTWTGQAFDVDLDLFRHVCLDLRTTHLPAAICRTHGSTWPLDQCWLDNIEPDPNFRDVLFVARSARYRDRTVDYAPIKKRFHAVFVGTKEEYADMRRKCPIAYQPFTNFLHMARAFKAGRFVGNQSFPFALSESLKIDRCLEQSPDVPNVVPMGGTFRYFSTSAALDMFERPRYTVQPQPPSICVTANS